MAHLFRLQLLRRPPGVRRVLLVALVALVAASLATTVAAEEVYWARSEPDCAERLVRRSTAQVLECGRFGVYEFSLDPLQPERSLCPVEAGGGEEPRALEVTGPSGGQETLQARACAGCETRDGAQVYTYIVDWFERNHGIAVKFNAAYASGGNWTESRYLERPVLPIADQAESQSDLHLLDTLCQISQIHQDHPGFVHRLINLSLGRLLDEPPCSQGDSLVCEISRILAFLRDEYGVVILAAAGNHDEMMFPASDPSTLSVGMLDLQAFYPGGEIRPQLHTPPGVDALMPGNGLAIGDGDPIFLGPGSSFATSLLTGWISRWANHADERLDFLIDEQPDGLISIVEDGGSFYLAVDGVPLPEATSAPTDRVVRRALGLEPQAFELQSWETTYQVRLAEKPWPHALPVSRAELTRDTNLPNPDSEPCVPCRMKRSRGRATTESIVLEVGSRGIAAEARLDHLLIQAGTELFALEGDDLVPLLADISLGADVEVEVDLPESLVSEQLYLVTLLTRLSDDRSFWDAFPITSHLDVHQPIFGDDFEAGDLLLWDSSGG